MTVHIAGKPRSSSIWGITQGLGSTKILTLGVGLQPNIKFGLPAQTVGLRATNVGLRAP